MGKSKKKREGNAASAVMERADNSESYVNDYDTSNPLILLSKKKVKKDKKNVEPINAKKLEAKKRRLEAKKVKESKAKIKKLAKIAEQKAKKQSREFLFESLSQYQLPATSLGSLTSTAQLQNKSKKRKTDIVPVFAKKLKSLAGGNIRSTIHNKEHEQKNYFETDSESGSDEEVIVGAPTCEVVESVSTSDDHLSSKVVDGNEKDVVVSSITEAKNVDDEAAVDHDSIEPTCSKEVDVAKPQSSVTLDNKSTKKVKQSIAEKFLKRKDMESEKQRQHILVERTAEIQSQRSKLPIFEEEQVIVEAVNENSSVIICGETGSGKTTQLPQFLYEAGYATDGKLIGITEPRRVAAISMASRVGHELGLPNIVSYQIRYEGNRSESTGILFMTDGVLMKELQKDILLSSYSVIIIDEAHERSMYSDVLIGLLSRITPLRAKTANPLKFIIMSATLRLSDFVQKTLFPISPPRVLKVEARQYPVIPYFERVTPQNYLRAAFRKVCKIHEKKPSGTILVFLSGRLEVETLCSWLIERYSISKGTRRRETVKKRGRLKKVDLDDYKAEEGSQCEDLNETGVADTAFDDDYDIDMKEESSDAEGNLVEPPPPDVMPLYCLPLYSLLSTEKQKRVFEPIPENCRGCVVATNVAETSLTIPGVRYVVDSGREKRRIFDPVTGVSKFSVEWISQASADQRMGRAGRVQAGEAFRLYSSQVYADLSKFSEPEILSKPVDQLVLHMKSINIVKVGNFPFPSRPTVSALEEAEKRLIRLGALEVSTKNGSKEARVTLLGKTLSLFPLAPKYGKVLVMAKQNNLLPYACCIVAAFSVREPLIPIHSYKGDTNEATVSKMVEVLKQRKAWCGQGQSRRLGDVTVLLKAVLSAQTENGTQEACSRYGVRQKSLTEIMKLRRQLTNLINSACVLEEPLVLDPNLPPPDDTQARMLRQILVASLTENIARRVDRIATTENVPKGAYKSSSLQDYLFIDVSSVLYKEEPDWILFLEIVEVNGKKCMRDVVAVEPEWLPQLASSYCNFTPVKGAEPQYDAESGNVVIEKNCFFGDAEWSLGVFKKPVQEDINLYRLFAKFFLEGLVCPPLAEFANKLLASPSTMVKSWAKLQLRTEKILDALIKHEVTSKARLAEVWKHNSEFLLNEYLEWLPNALHDVVQLSWPPV